MVSMNDRLRPRVARAVERFAETLRAALGDDLVEIRVFGSQVTGRATDEFDVDDPTGGVRHVIPDDIRHPPIYVFYVFCLT